MGVLKSMFFKRNGYITGDSESRIIICNGEIFKVYGSVLFPSGEPLLRTSNIENVTSFILFDEHSKLQKKYLKRKIWNF